jgi:hypothetical protein
MAKSRPPYSDESRAIRMATRLDSAFDFELRSAVHAFHTSKPCVTCVSIPLVLTRTSPAVVAHLLNEPQSGGLSKENSLIHSKVKESIPNRPGFLYKNWQKPEKALK